MTDHQGSEQSNLASAESKRCPFCAELIKREAIVCRYCRMDLREGAHAGELSDQVAVAAAGVTAAVASDAPASRASVTTPQDEQERRADAKRAAAEAFGSRSTTSRLGVNLIVLGLLVAAVGGGFYVKNSPSELQLSTLQLGESIKELEAWKPGVGSSYRRRNIAREMEDARDKASMAGIGGLILSGLGVAAALAGKK